MGRTVATLVTITTYGNWLRGDERGWVENGVVYPAEPTLQAWDRRRMKHPPYRFPRDQWLAIGDAMGRALTDRVGLRVHALAVQSWHAHLHIGATRVDIAEVIQCAKEAARYHLKAGRPIWADGYDKRWCFDWPVAGTRLRYVQRHNVQNGWDPNPWPWLTTPPELVAWLADHPI